MSIEVKLTRPITEGEDKLSTLFLREPTVRDVADLGYPFQVVNGENGGSIEFTPRVVLKYVSRLAAVPPSSLDELSLADFSRLQTVVIGFFGDEAETPPT